MASWLPFLASRWAENKANHFLTDGLVRANEPETLVAWVDRYDGRPTAILIPSSSKSMVAFHSFWTHENDMLVGIKGVNGAAPLTAYDLSQLAESLLPETSAEAIKELELPSMAQFLNCALNATPTKELLNLAGDSGVKAQAATKASAFVTVEPFELQAILGMADPPESARTGIKSITALQGLMSFASDALEAEEVSPAEAVAIWEGRLQLLWIVAKGLAPSVRAKSQAPNDEVTDDRYLDLMGSFSLAPDKYPESENENPGLGIPTGRNAEASHARRSARNKSRVADEDEAFESVNPRQAPPILPTGHSRRVSPNRVQGVLRSDRNEPEEREVEVLPGPFGRTLPTDPQSERDDGSESDTDLARRPTSDRKRKRALKKKTARTRARGRGSRGDRHEKRGSPGSSPSSSDSDSSSPERGRSGPDRSPPAYRKRDRKPRATKKKRSNDHSSSEDSLFASSDNSSTDSETDTKKRKNRRRKTGARQHDTPLADSIAYLADEMGYNNRVAHKKELRRSSLLSAWTKESVRLFRLLSAQSWNERGTPRIPSEAKRVMNLKKVTGAISQIRQDSYDWEGTVCHSGLTKFLAEGFLAQEITDSPGGITVFMCVPLSKSRLRQSAAERERALSEAFGVGHLSESTAKELAKAELCIPENLNEALDQLSVVIHLLDYLTGTRSIASETYRSGRTFIKDRRREFNKAHLADPLFITKFLYMLDRIFQRFCMKLLSSTYGSRDPIRRASRILEGFQADCVYAEMRSFDTIGAIPPLPLPTIIEERSRRPGKSIPEKGPSGTEIAQDKSERKKKKEQTEITGNAENKELVAGWRIPEGKLFADLFGKSNPKNKEGFPKVAHHDATKKRPVKPCIAWHTAGKCDRKNGCFASHIPAASMSAEVRKQIQERLEQIYL